MASAQIDDLESRFATVPAESSEIVLRLPLVVADVSVEIALEQRWSSACLEFCQHHWQAFRAEKPEQPQVRITLSPASAPYLDSQHAIWNDPEPFQTSFFRDSKQWIFHRDFTAAIDIADLHLHAWLPEPSVKQTDALDNILTIALRRATQTRSTFLLHATAVEHRGAAVVFFGPSGIGKSTLAKLSHDLGYRVMSSDQVYMGLTDGRPWVSACPTTNPDLPRNEASWAINKLWVKSLFNLQRKGGFELATLTAAEMSRRLFTELFCDLASAPEEHFRAALAFAAKVASDDTFFQGSLSYSKDFNFWPSLEKIGYI